MLTLEGLVRRKEVIICIGSGGVGKTTTSAVLALRAAAMGKKAVVLTIDPAMRLADSLGLDGLTNQPKRVDPERLSELGVPVTGELSALMLNAGQTLEDIVRQHTTSEEHAQRIFNSAIYKQGIESIIGSPEYMAMEKLYELYESGKYDLVVLDTPPAKHALDFLTAPERMVNFLTDNKLLKVMIRPTIQKDTFGARLVRMGTAGFMKALNSAFSPEFMEAGSEFFTAMNGLYPGFKSRAERVYKLFREERLGFVLVTSPNRLTIDEAVYLHEKLIEFGMPFEGIVVNKVHLDHLKDEDGNLPAGHEQLADLVGKKIKPDELHAALAGGLDAQSLWNAALPGLLRNFRNYQVLAEIDEKNLERLRYLLKGDQFMQRVPYLREDIHDMSGLRQISGHLFDGSEPAPA